MTTALEEIGELLSEVGTHGSFTARRTAATDDLLLEVKGYGRVRFPISRTQAERLCRVARPARYGRGERTLLDKRVRDTWKIAKSRVKIDKRRWNRTLAPVLDGLRGDLGLPEGCELKAELHAMLVYAPGQFFLPHQDSEKADEMVGTLVVVLPSSYKGGVMVIEHQGEKVTYRASKKPLTFIAFYADCQHEVRPVREGYRIVLTYNLMLAGDPTEAATTAAETEPATVDALAELLREHFETPRPSRWSWQKDALPREPASRLVYLLDHQYTERGFGWHRLKGNDAARVAALRAAAERYGCESMLALAEVHETWDCMEPGWDRPRYGRHRRWARDEDDEWATEPPPRDDPEAYELGELLDGEITLNRWIDPSGKKAEAIVAAVGDEEVCSSTPSSDLEPYASEYEGYMGNWGNTMDRWYRRAAVVLWPRERAFAVRAEASPSWALKTIAERIRGDDLDEARKMAASVLPFWDSVATGDESRVPFVSVLRVADGLDDPALATSLLRSFWVEALTPGRARAWVALVARYGEGWARALVAEWRNLNRKRMRFHGKDRFAWLASLPRLCEALRKADDAEGPSAARVLLEDQWEWLKHRIDGLDLERSSIREEAVASLARPLLGFLESSAVVKADDLRDAADTFLCGDENERLLPCLTQMLRAAAKKASPASRAGAGLDAIERHCVRLIEARLAQPARDEDDWSIVLPGGCDCELCAILGDFLADPASGRLDWPIAKAKRMHVHQRLDAHELPVRHETRRSGRPYTLVLTKTDELFTREAAERRALEADLEWLIG